MTAWLTPSEVSPPLSSAKILGHVSDLGVPDFRWRACQKYNSTSTGAPIFSLGMGPNPPKVQKPPRTKVLGPGPGTWPRDSGKGPGLKPLPDQYFGGTSGPLFWGQGLKPLPNHFLGGHSGPFWGGQAWDGQGPSRGTSSRDRAVGIETAQTPRAFARSGPGSRGRSPHA